MKQITFAIIFMFGIIMSANAQFKVANNGKVAINSVGIPQSPLSINFPGYSNHIFSLSGNCSGIYCVANGDNIDSKIYGAQIYSNIGDSHNCVGIKAVGGDENGIGQNLKVNMGVIGIGGGGKRNVGVFGQTRNTTQSAGIYGTTYVTDGASVLNSETQSYTGFFHGDVKATGNLIVTGSIQGLLLGVSASNNTHSVVSSLERNTLLNAISGLTASSYKQTKPIIKVENDDFYKDDSLAQNIILAERKQTNIVEDQFYEKFHYALSSDELEKVFPDLVYTKDNGNKGINYVEMIPLLVQCINELKAELDEVKGENDAVRRAVENASQDETLQTSSIHLRDAKLYQNTPNPLTERTEIRFTLPDDAQNAYIYIFDMQGKMLRQIPVDASMQSVTINGYELSAGIYLYSLAVNGQEIDTKRMILSK